MPKRAIRVLLRSKLGVPFLQASDEEKEAMGKESDKIWKKWQAAGIKLLAHWSGPLDGFAHYQIFEAPDLDAAWQMDQDWWAAKYRRLFEQLEFHVGWQNVPDESD